MTDQDCRTRYIEAGIIVGTTFLAFALRLWVATAATLIETDGVRYVAIARQIQSVGSPFDILFHPLYPLWIAWLQPWLGDYEFSGRVVAALFGSALIAPAYGFVRMLLGKRAAMLSAALLAVHPGLVANSASVLCEAVYTFFLVLGVWGAWLGLARRQWAFETAAGAFFGLAYLTRPEGALYAIGFLVVTIIVRIRSGGDRRWVLGAAGMLAAFLVVAGPYLVYLHGALGYWTLSGKITHVLHQDLGIAVTAGQTDVGVLLSHSLSVAWQFLRNTVLFEKYVMRDLFPGALILFLLPGVLAEIRTVEWRSRVGILLGAALPPVATLAFHVESRVFLPALPFLMPVVAWGMIATARWIAREPSVRAWCVGLVLLAALSVAPYTIRPLLRPGTDGALYRQAARWVEDTQPMDVVVLDRKPFVAYYSGRRFASLEPIGPEGLASAAREAGASLVILDSRVLSDRPRLSPLLYGMPPSGMELLRDFDAGESGRIRILGLRDEAVRADSGRP